MKCKCGMNALYGFTQCEICEEHFHETTEQVYKHYSLTKEKPTMCSKPGQKPVREIVMDLMQNVRCRMEAERNKLAVKVDEAAVQQEAKRKFITFIEQADDTELGDCDFSDEFERIQSRVRAAANKRAHEATPKFDNSKYTDLNRRLEHVLVIINIKGEDAGRDDLVKLAEEVSKL